MIDIFALATLVLGVVLFMITLVKGAFYMAAAVGIIVVLFAAYQNPGSVDPIKIPTPGRVPSPNPFGPIGPFGLWING